MNRIQRYLATDPEEPRYGDFVVVRFERFGWVRVTHDVALRIRAELDRWIVPRWIEFPDLVGSFVRIRTGSIRSLVECTVEQRAENRRLELARDEEEKADRRPWDNDL